MDINRRSISVYSSSQPAYTTGAAPARTDGAASASVRLAIHESLPDAMAVASCRAKNDLPEPPSPVNMAIRPAGSHASRIQSRAGGSSSLPGFRTSSGRAASSSLRAFSRDCGSRESASAFASLSSPTWAAAKSRMSASTAAKSSEVGVAAYGVPHGAPGLRRRIGAVCAEGRAQGVGFGVTNGMFVHGVSPPT